MGIDNHSRFFLRFAITPNCNFRCDYCNPDGVHQTKGILDDSEILQIMEAGINAGINRVHWTGGEPTLRNMKKIISKILEVTEKEISIKVFKALGKKNLKLMKKQKL